AMSLNPTSVEAKTAGEVTQTIVTEIDSLAAKVKDWHSLQEGNEQKAVPRDMEPTYLAQHLFVVANLPSPLDELSPEKHMSPLATAVKDKLLPLYLKDDLYMTSMRRPTAENIIRLLHTLRPRVPDSAWVDQAIEELTPMVGLP